MTTEKEIRCVAMHIFQPDSARLEELLVELELKEPKVEIRYDKSNKFDDTCMEIWYGTQVIGYVNADDKRYVEPLLRADYSYTAKFLEVYREDHHQPIVRFMVTVDLDDVEPINPGKEWASWQYTFPTIPMLKELSKANYAGDMLKKIIIDKIENNTEPIEKFIDVYVKNTLFDMSVETSQRYDDLLFYLETSRKRNRQYINTLQHGSTVRRTDKIRDKLMEQWWPRFLNGELSNHLIKSFATDMAIKYGSMSAEIVQHEYDGLYKELMALPYGLNEKIDDVKALWAAMYYTHIPRQKFIELMSAIVLYTRLKATVKNRLPFNIENTNVTCIIQGDATFVSAGEMNINKVIKNSGTINNG